MSGARAVGFMGKLPARADFVRQSIAEPIEREFDRWLVASVENLLQAKATLPEGVHHFVFSVAGQASVAIGAMANSQDQVGRRFPLAIFTSLPVADAAAYLGALPLAYETFMRDAESVLAQAQSWELDVLREGVHALVPPSAALLESSLQRLHTLLLATDAGQFMSQLLSSQPVDSRDYGLSTFCSATETARSAAASGPATVLDCPADAPAAVPAWLELARRRLQWNNRCPSFMWSRTPWPRLLLSLGAASDQLLHFVANPKHPSARLWPLTTDRAEAAARAQQKLSSSALALHDAEQHGASIDALWTLLSSWVA